MTDLATRTLGAPRPDRVPVLLLHAFPLDSRMLEPVAEALAEERTVLLVDLPGMGASAGVLPEPPSLDASADAVAAAARAAGVTRALVAGVSMGGYVTLALTERHPDLVAAVALLDSKTTADPAEARANRLRVAGEVEAAGSVDPVRGMAGQLLGETSRAARPELVERVAGWVGEQRAAGVAWSQRAMAARPDRTDVLCAAGVPVLLLVGDEDRLSTVADAEPVRARCEASLVVVPHAGHLAALEDPVAVAGALAELAGTLDQARGIGLA